MWKLMLIISVCLLVVAFVGLCKEAARADIYMEKLMEEMKEGDSDDRSQNVS